MKSYSTLFFFAFVLILVSCNNQEPVQIQEEAKAVLVDSTVEISADEIKEEKADSAEVTLHSIIGVGDMMLGTNYPNAGYLPANGGRDMLASVEHILQDADVTFGNLEGVLLDKGGRVKRCSNPDLCYAFRSPESYVNHFVNAGFDVVSIANNHTGDFGPEGRRRTKEVLTNAGIEFAGLAGTDEYALFEKNGVRYGFAAFAPNSGTVDVRNITRAKQIVSNIAAQSDIVIVSFHGGAEGAKHQHTPCTTEKFYGENRGNVCKFARAVVDAGADVVFGHGPHVTRGVELYNNRFIAYSLGNFCTYGRFNVRGPNGVAPIVKVYLDDNGGFVHAQMTSIYQAKTHGPKVDSQNRAVMKVKELTKADFPDTPLDIFEDGMILKR